jgi:hypothetical protein
MTPLSGCQIAIYEVREGVASGFVDSEPRVASYEGVVGVERNLCENDLNRARGSHGKKRKLTL